MSCSPLKAVVSMYLYLVLIITISEVVTSQNTTNTTNSTTDLETTQIVPLNLDMTTIASSISESLSTSVGNGTTTPESTILPGLPLSNEKPPDILSTVAPNPTKDELIAPKVQLIPPDCSHRERLRKQPKPSYNSKLRKCCPKGETLVIDAISPQYCETQVIEFAPQIVKVELYENCIEDLEEPVKLDLEVGNPCNESFIFAPSQGDRLAVLQDGSLLVMDKYANESYHIETSYCLDTSVQNGEIFAIVCVSSVEDHVGRSQTIFYTCFMLISVPCLCAVSFLHLAVKELRSVHGLSLGVMSACLAIGFLLHTIAQISEYYKSGLGYAVQFFMLAYFFWLCNLCCNVVLHVWYYLPYKILITRAIRYVHFICYALISFSIPLILVLVTKYKGLPGMPSYFFQGLTESIRESQRYFIPPVSCALVLSFCLLVFSFFGFSNLERISNQGVTYQQVTIYTQTTIPLSTMDQEGYQEIKKDAKCICILFIIIIITWILEVVTFYSPGPDDYIAFMEVVIGLQGVFILMIFIVIRRRRNAIVRWWHDRGSHEVTHVEMQNLRPSTERENGTQTKL